MTEFKTAGALLDYIRRRDASRNEGLIGGLELLAEDLSVSDSHD